MKFRGRILQGMSVVLTAFMSATAASAGAPEKPPVGVPIPATHPLVVEILLQDTLQAVSAASFRSRMQAATTLKPAAIVVNLSTPGGLPESASAMAKVIETSTVPVIVYLREPETHVSGEGLLLLEAGDVRVMGPKTVLIPSLAQTSTPPANAGKEQAALQADLQTMSARHGHFIPGIADLMKRDGTVAAGEALQLGAIDRIAPTEDRLLSTLRGVTVHRADGSTAVLQLGDSVIILLPMTAREHMMRALMNPDLTVLLLALGGLLIYLEINTPGGVIPGAAGLLLVLLAMYALCHMPLQWQGLLLLAVAALLLLAEAHFQRGKGFVVLAMLTLVVGLRLLVRAPIPELEVNWGTAIGAGVGFGGVTTGLLLLGLKARRAKRRTGAEAMLGWLAVTQTSLAPEGEILVRGELWRARLSRPDAYLPAGEAVKVERVLSEALFEVAPLPHL